MTRSDIDALFELLALYCPNDQRLKQKNLKSLWFETLEPYERDDVKKAVLGHFREHNFLPSVSEISIRCGVPASLQSTSPQKRTMGPMEARAKAAQDCLFARMKAERERLIPLRHAAGLPATMDEAGAAGMKYTEWMNNLDAAGLNYPDSVWREEAVNCGAS